MNITKIDRLFVEKSGQLITELDPNKQGQGIPTVKITYDNGGIRYILCTSFTEFNFESRKVVITCEEYLKSVGFHIEYVTNPLNKVFPMGSMKIDDSQYVYTTGVNTGFIEENPWENDLSKELKQNVEVTDSNGNTTIKNVSFNPPKYEQKIKSGLTTNYSFWFSYLLPYLIVPIQQRIESYSSL